jgi:branched-chain amino acid transport system permease protein
MGNIWGVAAGAFIVYLIQVVLLKQLNTITEALNLPILSQINFTDYQYLLFGIALVIMMLRRPEGLFPSQARRAELHTIEEPEIAGALGIVPGSDELTGTSEDIP